MRTVIVVAVAGLLSACTSLPVVQTGLDPSNPNVRVRPPRSAPVFAGSIAYRPIEPKGWVDINNAIKSGKGTE